MKSNLLSIDKIRKIRKCLPHGSQARIHETTGISKFIISRTLNGGHYHYAVIEEALRILEQENVQKASQDKRIEKILQG